MVNQPVRSHLELALLAVLATGPIHGYAIIETLRERSGGSLEIPEGTMYPLLHRLERLGLLHSHWDDGLSAARPRRVYALTPAGRGALRQRRGEWQRYATAIASLLNEPSDAE